MTLGSEQIQRIARLARIAVNEEEVADLGRKLSGIFRLIEEMQAVDTTGIDPMAHPLDLVQPLREDVVTETDQRELFQSLAPQVEDGLYLVPKVIE